MGMIRMRLPDLRRRDLAQAENRIEARLQRRELRADQAARVERRQQVPHRRQRERLALAEPQSGQLEFPAARLRELVPVPARLAVPDDRRVEAAAHVLEIALERRQRDLELVEYRRARHDLLRLQQVVDHVEAFERVHALTGRRAERRLTDSHHIGHSGPTDAARDHAAHQILQPLRAPAGRAARRVGRAARGVAVRGRGDHRAQRGGAAPASSSAAADRYGICANVHFRYLAQWLWQLIARVVPGCRRSRRSRPTVLAWRVARGARASRVDRRPSAPRGPTCSSADAVMRYELARAARRPVRPVHHLPARVARRVVARRSRPTSAAATPRAPTDQAWQAALWRRIARRARHRPQPPGGGLLRGAAGRWAPTLLARRRAAGHGARVLPADHAAAAPRHLLQPLAQLRSTCSSTR